MIMTEQLEKNDATATTQLKKKPNIPSKEADTITVSKDVSASWLKHPDFKLSWITHARFAASITAFEDSFKGRSEAKGVRSEVSNDLKKLNIEIDQSVEVVKGYITERYNKKEASVYYPQFGIVKVGKGYTLPRDNDKRRLALEQMLSGINSNEMNDKTYGKAYWTDINGRFEQIFTKSRTTDTASKDHVSNKTEQRIMIRKVLNALIHLIRANYPDTYRDELRKWGFQKEKY